MTTPEKIIELREKMGWNQKELASRAKLDQSVMNRIETGKRPIKDNELKTFADLFDVSTDYLLGRTNIPSPQEKGEMYFFDKENWTEEEIEEARAFIETRRKIKNKNKK